jgi:hypothetical protein
MTLPGFSCRTERSKKPGPIRISFLIVGRRRLSRPVAAGNLDQGDTIHHLRSNSSAVTYNAALGAVSATTIYKE